MKTLSKIIVTGSLLAGAVQSQSGLEEVTLFTSGVGYFESAYEIEEGRVELDIPGEALNDVLKSLVVYGQGGRSLHYAVYDADDPTERKLDELRISLDKKPGLLQLLSRLRGETIEVDWGGKELEGRILGTEIRKEFVEGDLVVFTEYISLWVDESVMRLPLEDLGSLYFPNEDLRDDLDTALTIYADELSKGNEQLELILSTPQGRINVGYVQEAPVWKMSYRLILNEDEAVLIGTAHVDHPKGVDWEDVKLTLISGQPISFVQDLHTPIYLSRPEVREEYALAEVPDADYGGMAEDLEAEAADSFGFGGARASKAELGRAAPAARSSRMMTDSMVVSASERAQADAVGELFAYEISDPVTLPAGQSAMIQVLAHEYEVDRFSVFNSSVHATHPVNACRLESGPYHLMPGPLTVMEEGLYAGDARVGNVSPGEGRSVSYSMDFTSKVLVESAPFVENLEKVVIADGIMTVHQSQRRTTLYKVKNGGDEEREYRIEHPKTHGWDLQNNEKGIDTTDSVYRIPFIVRSGQQETLTVVEERDLKREVRLLTLQQPQILNYLKLSGLSKEAAAVLKQIHQQLSAQTTLKQQLSDLKNRRAQITQDQQRLRENMRTVNRNSASYSRWETKLLEQENELETLLQEEEKSQAELRKQEAELRRMLNEFRTEG